MTRWGGTSIGLKHILVLGGDQFHTLKFLGRTSKKKHPVCHVQPILFCDQFDLTPLKYGYNANP